MPKKVVDCGNCGPDHVAIRRMIESNFEAVVIQSHGLDDTLEIVQRESIDLICVNRKLDRDYSDGIEVIRKLKSVNEAMDIPMMLVTNYEDHQKAALEVGAVLGFGKLALGTPETLATLEPHLGSASAIGR